MIGVRMKYSFLVIFLGLLPFLTFANTPQSGYSLQALIINLGIFLNNIIMPFIMAIAFLAFVVNVIRFFIMQSHEEEGRKNAKYLAIYSIGAFVFILSFWGIVNLLILGIGLNRQEAITPDYIENHQNPRGTDGCGVDVYVPC